MQVLQTNFGNVAKKGDPETFFGRESLLIQLKTVLTKTYFKQKEDQQGLLKETTLPTLKLGLRSRSESDFRALVP